MAQNNVKEEQNKNNQIEGVPFEEIPGTQAGKEAEMVAVQERRPMWKTIGMLGIAGAIGYGLGIATAFLIGNHEAAAEIAAHGIQNTAADVVVG